MTSDALIETVREYVLKQGRAPKWPVEDALDQIQSRLRAAETAHGEGVNLIAAERQRQIAVEGWTAEHDSGHIHDELAYAAACYAIPPRDDVRRAADPSANGMVVPDLWPWELHFWKPNEDRLTELARAGALIAAEIDRIARAFLEGATE